MVYYYQPPMNEFRYLTLSAAEFAAGPAQSGLLTQQVGVAGSNIIKALQISVV